MNREERRAMVKHARKSGMTKTLARAYAEIASGVGEHTKPNVFEEGDAVRLNVEAIKARKNYKILSPMYKEFVEAAGDTIYTAHIEREYLISLKEEPKWLFWSGDLIKCGELSNETTSKSNTQAIGEVDT